MDAPEPQGADHHHGPSVCTVGRRALRQPGIRRLDDDDAPGLDADLQRPPEFEKCARLRDRLGLATS